MKLGMGWSSWSQQLAVKDEKDVAVTTPRCSSVFAHLQTDFAPIQSPRLKRSSKGLVHPRPPLPTHTHLQFTRHWVDN